MSPEGHRNAPDTVRKEIGDMQTNQHHDGMTAAIEECFADRTTEQHEAPQVVGDPGLPGATSPTVHQAYADTCAIRCQELILKDFGFNVSEDDLVRLAREHGWYVPGCGTPEDDLGKILEARGVEVNRYEHANVFNLVSELAQGHRVIIALDSGELWDRNDVLQHVTELNEDKWQGWRPDHAVLVSGVDVSDPDHPMVIVTDPGTGEVAATYPLAEFMDAWEDSGFSMVATKVAPEQFPVDHVAYIGDMPYADFERLYPSVAGMTGQEHGFSQFCDEFMQTLRSHAPAPLAALLAQIETVSGHPSEATPHHSFDDATLHPEATDPTTGHSPTGDEHGDGHHDPLT